MSLFEAREWWSSRPDGEDEFTSEGFLVANIDDDPTGNGARGDTSFCTPNGRATDPAQRESASGANSTSRPETIADKIITGSLGGVLRVYTPRRSGESSAALDTLLLEMEAGGPILQLAAGRQSNKTALAVLHPRKLVVYEAVWQKMGGLGTQDSASDALDSLQLHRAYGHELGEGGEHFTAFNMTYGEFGGAFGKESICVQSMDGQLAFFEQDKPSFLRQIPDCLFPGPIAYIRRTDSIVVGLPDMTVASFRYNVLASASGRQSSSAPAAAGASGVGATADGKSVKPEWEVNIGEHAQAIRPARLSKGLSSSQVDVLVVGQHTVFCLQEAGGTRTRLQKRMGFPPSALSLYNVSDGKEARGNPAYDTGAQNLILATHGTSGIVDGDSASAGDADVPATRGSSAQLMVFRESKLVWAARTGWQAVAVGVGQFHKMPGLVATMDALGGLYVTYMGTDPPVPSATAFGGESRELDLTAMDREHQSLLAQIRERQRMMQTEPQHRIIVRVDVPDQVDALDSHRLQSIPGVEEQQLRSAYGGAQLDLSLFLSYTGPDGTEAEDVQIAIDPPTCVLLTSGRATMTVGRLPGGNVPPHSFSIPLISDPRGMPMDRTLRVTVTYRTHQGEPSASLLSEALPLGLFTRVVAPVRNPAFKLTLDTNRRPPPLSDLFRESLRQPGVAREDLARAQASAENVLSFRYYNGADVSILAAAASGRYRVQAGSLEALYLLAHSLESQLLEYFRRNTGDALPPAAGADRDHASAEGPRERFQVSYSEPLPLADFFSAVDDHLNCRTEWMRMHSRLNDRAHQFRQVQKRLLTRYRDRNPAPVTGLDKLLTASHEQIIAAVDEIERSSTALRQSANRLGCATRLLILLLRLRCEMSAESVAVLESSLSPIVDDSLEQGWEERVDAALLFLLRTILSKAGDNEDMTAVSSMEMPADTNELKQHVTYLCDRLYRGAKLVGKRKKPKSETKAS